CFYADHFRAMKNQWDALHGNIIGAFARLADEGHLELLTCSATHAFLPGLLPTYEGVRSQLELGKKAFRHFVGREPLGLWTPECAFDPRFDREIGRAGFRFTIVDTHGITDATPTPPFGAYAPIVSPSGTAFFARDPEASEQVWARSTGYPGDPWYRDFYRDIGFDLAASDLGEHVIGNGERLMTGIKYHRITGDGSSGGHKEPYQPGVAHSRAKAHGEHFVRARLAQLRRIAMDRAQAAGFEPHDREAIEKENRAFPPIMTAPYDAELFGHWWFEGPLFLEAVFRAFDRASKEGWQPDDHGGPLLPVSSVRLQPITLRRYLEKHPFCFSAMPAASTWGKDGYGEVWIGNETGWMWRHVHHATRYAVWLRETFLSEISKKESANSHRTKALNLLLREVLLLQSSDWAFIVTTATSVAYAEARFRAHIRRIRHLGYLVESGQESAPPGDLKERSWASEWAWMDQLDENDNFLKQFPEEALRSAFDSAIV
nr:DUF1957 domain-containing protein [Polyangiaceae bacterium]